jgi:ribokinase
LFYNLGSINIDRVFRVDHLVRPGETIASAAHETFAGGKGANQSVALARAGARVAHIGKIGPDGIWLREKLARDNIDTRWIVSSSSPTGQAIIQVDATGQNAIVLAAGANHEITPAEIDAALAGAAPGSWLLAQNETSSVVHAVRRAHQLGLRVAFNPAPCDRAVNDYPLELVDLLCVNETEGGSLSGQRAPQAILEVLARRLPGCEILLTLGADGALRRAPDGQMHEAGFHVGAVDTTAAGDTFLGYYLAGMAAGLDPLERLRRACRAAAVCISRPGALDSIPRLAEVLKFCGASPGAD